MLTYADAYTYNNSKLKAEIQERLELRARKEAYKCLEEFVSDPRSTKKYLRPDKLCSFPWLNCSHTVDTLLRERCENPEHLDEARATTSAPPPSSDCVIATLVVCLSAHMLWADGSLTFFLPSLFFILFFIFIFCRRITRAMPLTSRAATTALRVTL
jgi:hypothetical protein